MKILVVEDDRKIKTEIIDDVLASLGHDSDWAQNQREANDLLAANTYDLALLDLQIPSRPGGKPLAEFGKHLLNQFHERTGRGNVPVIIMTGYHQACVDMSTELHKIGVNACISKPFPETGRTLAAVIKDVMAQHRRWRQAAASKSKPESLRPFDGGLLAFHPDRIDLCGETVATNTKKRYAWRILHLLKERNTRGKFVRMGSRRLAAKLHPNMAQNTLIQAIKALRGRISQVMDENLGEECGPGDVISNVGKGYYLRDWIVVEIYDEAGTLVSISRGPEHVDGGGKVDDRFGERQQWVLAQLAEGVKLTRRDVEQEFRICARTAKRDLAELTEEGLIEFDRSARPGYYRLE
ncbi:MAG: response regulator transcription factor [Phycisphaerae bacterium]|nr:response regulator transcription factor [Phycisphaerae bacterium]